MYNLLLTGWLLGNCMTALAQVSSAIFDHISVEDGLSQSEVNAILKDRDGFMWFGTVDGLNKYDGYRFTAYKNAPFDSTTLSHNYILCLHEDRAGNVWVGTEYGLNRFDRLTGKFVRFFSLLQAGAGIGHYRITAIQSDQWGTIWVGTWQGLKRLIPVPAKDGQTRYEVRNYQATTNFSDSLSSDAVRTMLLDKTGTLWVGTLNGLNQVVIQNPQEPPVKQRVSFRHAGNSSSPVFSLSDPSVLCLAEDMYGNLWAGTSDGLNRIDPAEQSISQLFHDPARPSSIGDNMVYSLLSDSRGDLWMGTFTNGITRMKLTSRQTIGQTVHYREDVRQVKGLKSNTIYSLYESKDPNEDVVWIGTRGAGILKYSRTKNNFKLVNNGMPGSLTANSTFAIYTDRKGFLWIGNQQGLLRIDRTTDERTWFRHEPGNPASLSNNYVTAIREDRQGNLWIGTTYGLNLFQPHTQTFQRFYFSDYPDEPKTENFIHCLYEDRKGNLWMGTRYDLKKFDYRTGKTISHAHDPDNPHSIHSYIVTAIQEDRQGNLWVGTHFGLNKLDTASGRFTRFLHEPSNVHSLISNTVFSIAIDSAGVIWLGTDRGISKLTHRNGRAYFTNYTEQDGLVNDYVYSVLCDPRNRVWASTNLGLSKFNPAKNQFKNYDISDGLPNNEFNAGAFHQSASGELFFGGNGGVVYFNPLQITRNRHLPSIRIASFHAFEKQVNLDSALAKDGKLYLSYRDNFISFEFAALDYTNPAKNQYAYKLEGLHDGWMYSGTRRYASFTGLSPGEYTFRVMGSNNDDVWNDNQQAIVKLVVLPPFWRTSWFFVLSVAVITGAVWLFNDYHVRSKVHRLIEIEKVKLTENERVRKLAAEDLHDEFGNRLTRISLLTELIKTRLNGNATEVTHLLTKISDNASQLYQGTKDFIWAINPENDSLYEAAIRLKDFGDDLFDKTPVTFEVSGITDALRLVTLPMGDSRHFILLFKEAMSNILKHAQARHVQLTFQEQAAQITVQLTDNGKGFDQLQATGGNGLMNMQSRARKLSGSLQIASNVETGTQIQLKLPVLRPA